MNDTSSDDRDAAEKLLQRALEMLDARSDHIAAAYVAQAIAALS